MSGTTHKHTNRLAEATSPYLLQHAHNPVEWYEWGPEAVEKAKREDKPIFLSIGYAACEKNRATPVAQRAGLVLRKLRDPLTPSPALVNLVPDARKNDLRGQR